MICDKCTNKTDKECYGKPTWPDSCSGFFNVPVQNGRPDGETGGDSCPERSKMKSYKITYNGRSAYSRGDDACEAFDRYCERIQKFNSYFNLPWDAELELIDADTHGKQWATYFNHSEMYRITVDRFEKEGKTK